MSNDRVEITDSNGNYNGWFYPETTIECYGYTHDYGGESLYLTPRANWVLNVWSKYEGDRETYRKMTPEKAARWLIKHNYELPDELVNKITQDEV